MSKLAPARVSYRHDFLISYRVYMMTGLFHISLFEGTLHVDKMHVANAFVTSKLINFSTRQTQGVCQGLPSLRYRVAPPTLRVCTDGRAGVRLFMSQPNSLVSIDFQCL